MTLKPNYYLKYLLEQMPQYYNDPDKSYMPDMRPWSEQYISYETAEKQDLPEIQLPQGWKKQKLPKNGIKPRILRKTYSFRVAAHSAAPDDVHFLY